MSSYGKIAKELLGHLDDKIASLKSAGKHEEALALEKSRAVTYKKLKQEGKLETEVTSEALEPLGPMEQAGPLQRPHVYGNIDTTPGTEPVFQPEPSANYPGLRRFPKSPESGSDATFMPNLDEETLTPEVSPSPVGLMGRLKSHKGKLGAGGAAGAGAGYYLLNRDASADAESPVTESQAKDLTAALGTEAGAEDALREPKTLREALTKVTPPKRSFNVPSPRAEKPESLDALLGKLKENRPSAKEFDVSPYENERKEAESRFTEDRNRADNLALADRIGRAAVQIGAGMQGLKTNVDLSNLKGEPLDVARFDTRAREDRSRAMEATGRKEISARDALKQVNESEQSAAGETRDILAKDYFNRYQAYKQAQLEAQQAAKELQMLDAKNDSAEYRAGLKVTGQDSKPAKEAKKKVADQAKLQTKRAQDMRRLDELLGDMAESQETGKSKELQKAKEQAEKLFSDLYPSVEDRDTYFKGSKPDGMWEQLTGGTSKIDVRAIRQYNTKNLGQTNRTLEILNTGLTSSPAVNDTSDTSNPSDPNVEKYAKQYSLSYEQAQQILEKRGYRGQP